MAKIVFEKLMKLKFFSEVDI